MSPSGHEGGQVKTAADQGGGGGGGGKIHMEQPLPGEMESSWTELRRVCKKSVKILKRVSCRFTQDSHTLTLQTY